MPRFELREIYMGGKVIPLPKNLTDQEVEEKISQKDPENVRENWAQKSKESSELAKKICSENSIDLERMKIKRDGQPTSEDLFKIASRQNQLGSQSLSGEPTENHTDSESRRYSLVRPFYPRTHMWLRSFEQNRKNDFSENS